MGTVLFYHLTRSPLEVTLPALLSKALEAGWHVELRGRSPERMDWLDAKLWLGPEEGFLPHGRVGGPHDERQPVLLTHAAGLCPPRPCLMAIDRAEVSVGEAAAARRVCIVFDADDPEALAWARGQWRAVTGAGLGAQYWSDQTGRWAMKAESPARTVPPPQ